MPNPKRKLRPRERISVTPLAVSQLNVEPIFGINAGRYLEILPRLGIRVSRVGKLRVVDAAELRDALARLAAEPQPAEDDVADEPDDPLEDAQPRSVDDVLACLGRRLDKPAMIGGARLTAESDV